MSPPTADLPRRFGFWTGLFVVVASMVGGGILTTSGFIIRDTQSHAVLLWLWIAGGVLATCGAVTLAELASAMPRVGGEYAYIRTAFGPGAAFVYGAATIVLAFAAPIAVIAHATVAHLTPAVSGGQTWLTPLLASLLIAGVCVLHVLGQRESAWLQGLTTVFKLLTLLGVAIAGLGWGEGRLGHFATGRPWSEQSAGVLAVALIQVTYAYSGWNGAAYLAGEIRDPRRRLPACLIGGCLLVTALYVLLNVVYGYALSPETVATLPPGEVERVAETAAAAMFGRGTSRVLSVLIGVGLLASLSAFVLTGSRLAFAMARDRVLPAAFARVHPRRTTPALATLLQGALALVVLWSGSFDAMVTYSGAGMALLAGMVMLCVFALRRRRLLPAAFATPLFPLPPLLYLAVLGWMVTWAIGEAPVPTLLSIASIALMWPLHRLLRPK